MRSFDERHHSYQGYVLRIDGTCGDEIGEFLIAVGKAAHEKHQFRAGMVVSGLSVTVPDPRLETAGFYKTSGIKTEKNEEDALSDGPPFLGVPPDLTTYRQRGHRRLDARTYEAKCITCIWACRMPVEMIIDHWNPSTKRYRFETFCYGPNERDPPDVLRSRVTPLPAPRASRQAGGAILIRLQKRKAMF